MSIERIAVGEKIIYDDVIDSINEKIKAICCNVDTYSVPAAAKDLRAGQYVLDSEVGIEPTINGKNISTKKDGELIATIQLTSSSWRSRPRYRTRQLTIPVNVDRTFYEYFTINDMYKAVSLDEVTRQLNQFLSMRGVATKRGQVITARGLMNIFNNIAIFMSCKLKAIRSNDNPQIGDGNVYVFYDQYTTNYFLQGIDDLHGIRDTNDSITINDLDLAYKSLLDAFIDVQRQISNKLILSYASSSSSSSSSCSSCSCSSSSCSCSSSSSSSVYIVYMMI